MFKINFLKKHIGITLESLNRKEHSSQKDWLIIMIISTSMVTLAAIFSIFLFLGSMKEDFFESGPSTDRDFVIQESRLDSAVDFIQSRSD